MSTYYLSQQRGNNSNDGLSPGAAKLTWAGVQAVATGVGDIIYIGPGTYREKPVIQNNDQQIIADPLCKVFTTETPGRVRITGCGVDEIPTGGSIINGNAKTGLVIKGHSIDAMLQVDGCSNDYVIRNTVPFTLQFAIVAGYTGAFNPAGLFDRCVADTLIDGFVDGNSNLCYSLGATRGFRLRNTAGAAITCLNCITEGGQDGYYSNNVTYALTAKNCAAFRANRGAFNGDSRGLAIVNCLALQCVYGAYGTSTSYPLDIAELKHCGCMNIARGGGYDTGTPTGVGTVHCDWPARLRASIPIISAGLVGLGTAGLATDMIGRAFANPPSIGPWEIVDSIGRMWRPDCE